MCARIAETRNNSEIIQDKIKKRQISNLEIVNILNSIVNRHPELRFCQILTILNLDKDKFYEESVDTLENLQKLAEKL